MLSCNDICDKLVEKLLAAGFKINTQTEDHHDIWKALNECTIIKPSVTKLCPEDCRFGNAEDGCGHDPLPKADRMEQVGPYPMCEHYETTKWRKGEQGYGAGNTP